jgi:eukaryotic-like serine/threonine-protein kinase
MSKPELSQLGRYRIAGELGRGAMGVVYKAEDPVLNRSVAVKTILMPADAEARIEYEARFFQEAKAAAGLNHPNIITVHDAGREGDVVYMTMELLDGVDLRDFLKRGRVALSLGLDIAAQLADGLAVAHDQGVIHRDIKPANIMIVRDRYAKIMDFGIARIRLSDVKTQTGAVLGSPKYMSPEQVSGQRADHRSDIFSLGVTVYEMLVGQPPFSADDIGQLMYQVSMTPAEPPSSLDPSLPTMLDLVLAKALEKAAHARYQSARDFAADLRACQSDDLTLETSGVVEDRFRVQQTAGATRTLKLNATLAAGAAGNVQLSLSRRFDSSEASRRFDGNIAGLGGTSAQITPLQRLLKDPYRRGLTISLAASTVLALGIALL